MTGTFNIHMIQSIFSFLGVENPPQAIAEKKSVLLSLWPLSVKGTMIKPELANPDGQMKLATIEFATGIKDVWIDA